MDRVGKAEEYFMAGYNCSQSVFAAFADRYGIEEEQALRLASPLGAGISAMREVCGAVTAMSMVCGLESGHTVPEREAKQKAYESNRRLLDDFLAEHHSIVCRTLLGLLREENRQAPRERTEQYYRERPCLRLVRSAAEILEKYFPDEA